MPDLHLSADVLPRRWSWTAWSVLAGCALLLAMLPGCGRKEPIRKTRVRTDAAIDKIIEKSTPPSEIDAPPEMILGRIVPLEEKVWFFKAAGSLGELAGRNEQLLALLLSVEFGPGGYPYWILPEGWREVPSRAGRYATIYMGSDEDAPTITVNELDRPKKDLGQWLALNIARWQSQLRVASDQIGLRQVAIPSAIPGDTMVSIRKVPPGRGFRDFGGGLTGHASGEAAPTIEIHYELPEGWSEARGDQFSLRAFETTVSGKPVRTTITLLPRGQATLADNVNRWRRQVGLSQIDADQVADQSRSVRVSGFPATVVELYGPAQSPQRGILGAIVPDGDQWWFIKLSGDADAVRSQQQPFTQFLKSVRLPGASESDTLQPGPPQKDGSDVEETASDPREGAGKTNQPATDGGDGTSEDDVKTGEKDPGNGQ